MDIKKLSSTLQYRPRDSADRRMYSPDRDVAYLVPILMQLTTNSFYEDGAAREDAERLLTVEEREQFVDMVVTIGAFCQDFMRGDRTFGEAMAAAGLNKFPHKLMYLWLAHFGHTVMSAFYHGCRGVMMKGDEQDPMPYDKIFDSAEEIREFLWGTIDG